MKTKEVIEATGLSKQTILYYEKEGLIMPDREDNEYRNYSEATVQNLLVIKFLRSININIEDIRAILQKQLSFQECLQNQTSYIETAIDELQHIKKSIQTYKDKQLPLVPTLREIDSISAYSLWRLGYQKTTSLITLGRCLTRKLLGRMVLGQCFFTLIITWILSTFYINPFLTYGISFLVLFSLRMLILAKGLGSINIIGIISGTTIYQSNPLYYIEFLETGVRYYKFGKVSKQLHYLFDIVCKRDVSAYLAYYPYEEVSKVSIQRVTRYVGIQGIMAIHTYTYDFKFFFEDQTSYFLYNPITLDHDLRYALDIMIHKIKDVEDHDHVIPVKEEQ